MKQSTRYRSKSERVKQAERMHLRGHTRQEIADALGVKTGTVSGYLTHAFKPPVTNRMLIEMFRLYNEVGNWSEVARRLGTVRQVINYWKKVAKKRGISEKKA